MEVCHRQQLGLAGRQPLGAGLSLAFGTVPVAAGIVGVADEAALAALLDVPAEGRRPAPLDGAHHPPLDTAQVTVMRPRSEEHTSELPSLMRNSYAVF